MGVRNAGALSIHLSSFLHHILSWKAGVVAVFFLHFAFLWLLWNTWGPLGFKHASGTTQDNICKNACMATCDCCIDLLIARNRMRRALSEKPWGDHSRKRAKLDNTKSECYQEIKEVMLGTKNCTKWHRRDKKIGFHRPKAFTLGSVASDRAGPLPRARSSLRAGAQP